MPALGDGVVGPSPRDLWAVAADSFVRAHGGHGKKRRRGILAQASRAARRPMANEDGDAEEEDEEGQKDEPRKRRRAKANPRAKHVQAEAELVPSEV